MILDFLRKLKLALFLDSKFSYFENSSRDVNFDKNREKVSFDFIPTSLQIYPKGTPSEIFFNRLSKILG